MPGFTAETTLYRRGVHYQMVGTGPIYVARVVPQAWSWRCDVACSVCRLGGILGPAGFWGVVFACGYCTACIVHGGG